MLISDSRKFLQPKNINPGLKHLHLNGRAPEIGEMWRSAGHAQTLRSIAETNAESFYKGELADKMAEYVQKHGGFLTKEDLAAYKAEWVEANFR